MLSFVGCLKLLSAEKQTKESIVAGLTLDD